MYMAVDTVFGLDTLSRVYFTSVVDQDESCVLWRFESALKEQLLKEFLALAVSCM